jgi:mannose-6-phosphate isomerase-like protein (cupin superfamily)
LRSLLQQTIGPEDDMIIDTAEENNRVDALTGTRPGLAAKTDAPSELAALRRAWLELDSIPILLMSRDEGEDHSWMGLDVRALLRAEQSSGRIACHDIILAPGARLPTHFHESGHAYWCVIDGPVAIQIGNATELISSGGFAYAPPLTRQGVSNPGSAPVRLFLSYRPAGADRAFAAAHAHWAATKSEEEAAYLDILSEHGFCFDKNRILENDQRTNQPAPVMDHEVQSFEDFIALRERWYDMPAYPRLLGPNPPPTTQNRLGVRQEGEDAEGLVFLTGDEDSGSNVVFKSQVAPGFIAGNHHQPSEEELFYIFDGELQLTCGSATRVVGKGAFGFAPRNATHGFRNTTNTPATMITMNSPAGHERGFRMMMREGGSEQLPRLMHAHGWRLHY